MKRQIKFRGKRVDTGEWVIGCLVGYHQAYYDGNSNRVCISSGILTTTEVDPDTVGQFTGLLDKNGKEIYEGDILGFEREKNFEREVILPFVVKWSDYGNGMVGWTQFTPIEMIVIIGNMFDNLNLLENDVTKTKENCTDE